MLSALPRHDHRRPRCYLSNRHVTSQPTSAQRFEDGASTAPCAKHRVPRAWAFGYAGVAAFALAPPLVMHAWVAGGFLAVLAIALGAYAARSIRRVAVDVRARALVLDGTTLAFDGGAGAPLAIVAELAAPFGLTLVANRARSQMTMVVTTVDATFYVCTDVRGDERVVARPLLAAAFTVASDERALAAAAPDGAPLRLSVAAFARLHAALSRLDPGATQRLFLSDARGEPVTLDGPRIVAGVRALDLTASLEWHGLLFRERAFGGGVAVYQGTHVRQGSTELVFVSLMPALTSPSVPGDVLGTAEPVIERAVLRDLALMHEAAEEPPPGELRVAVERVFMLPLRAALSTARQRSSSKPDLGRRDRPLRAS